MGMIEDLKKQALKSVYWPSCGEVCLEKLRLPALCAVAVILAEMPAAAYTDPGSGALLWQVLVAGFVGAMFYFRRFTRWVRRKTGRESN